MGGIVAMVPKALSLSQEEAYRLGRDLDEWSQDRSHPLVLSDGIQLATIGGLTFHVLLTEGPLAWMRFSITVPSLTDLPDSFEWEGGRYVRHVEDGVQFRDAVDGGPDYIWQANP